MKSKKSRLIIGGIVTLLIVGLLLSVFSFLFNQVNDIFDNIRDILEENDEITDVEGEDLVIGPSPDTGDSIESDNSDESLNTFTFSNGRLGYTVRKGKYNNGSGELDCYILCIGTKEAPKSNTTYRVKWNINQNFSYYVSSSCILQQMHGNTSLYGIYRFWSVDGVGHSQAELNNSGIGNVLNLDYSFTTGEGDYSYIMFGSIVLLTENSAEATSMAKKIVDNGYLSNCSITEEVTE